ncbi:hypothetical protein Scep_002092 [Stephania cephalantha]|uniref:Uncharacterized protein n=1 Tax=Stephania cephalantha TaxID=152367 RepID=A0AAP0Q8F5_9MAGN
MFGPRISREIEGGELVEEHMETKLDRHNDELIFNGSRGVPAITAAAALPRHLRLLHQDHAATIIREQLLVEPLVRVQLAGAAPLLILCVAGSPSSPQSPPLCVMNEDPRPYPPKAILAEGHSLILLRRAGLLRDKLGSSRAPLSAAAAHSAVRRHRHFACCCHAAPLFVLLHQNHAAAAIIREQPLLEPLVRVRSSEPLRCAILSRRRARRRPHARRHVSKSSACVIYAALLPRQNSSLFTDLKSMISVGLASIASNTCDFRKAVHGENTLPVLCIGHGGGSLPLFLPTREQRRRAGSRGADQRPRSKGADQRAEAPTSDQGAEATSEPASRGDQRTREQRRPATSE